MPRALLTGASGLLGRAILRELEQSESWDVLGLAFSRAKGKLQKCDLTCATEIEKVIQDYKPDVLIHSAAERRPDVVSNNEAATAALNVEATETLAKLTVAHGIKLVYMSTDYVFDGTKPPYKEGDEPNPLNRYGQTKLAGEKVVLQHHPDAIVLRVPILYGEVEFVDESAVTTIFKKVKDTATDTEQEDLATRFPTLVADVAVVLRQLLEQQQKDASVKGIYHWSGNESYTKYGMALVMAEVFGLPTSHIKPNKTPPTGSVKRPENSQLCSEKVESIIPGQRTPFHIGIKTALEPFFKQ